MHPITLKGIRMTALLAATYTASPTNASLTHTDSSTALSEINMEALRAKISANTSPTLPVEDEYALLEDLAASELGQFLLKNKGLNGYWTAYLILKWRDQENLTDLERWLVTSAPAVLATQERFGIFQKVIQAILKNDMTLASVPCGLMDDLLGLGYTEIHNTTLVGIDLDPDSLNLAAQNAQNYPHLTCSFEERDAWNLENRERFDLVTSNGLNIYEPNDARCINLYQQIFESLKPGGIFVTSFLTPPPGLSPDSTWRNFDVINALKQKALFGDIIGVTWQAFRTEAQMREHLTDAGFHILEILYDSQGMFPTIVVQK